MTKIKNISYTVLVIFLVSIFLGCVGKEEPKEELAPDGKVLYNYITKVNNYKNWNKWPGTVELYAKSPGSPHGDFLTTYVDNRALSAIEGKKGKMEQDSIVVKENYDSNKKLDALTVMFKEEGYNPQHGDWFWAKYAADGTIQAEGKFQGCIDCHGKKDDNDYLFTGSIK